MLTEILTACEVVDSVGSHGDTYDQTLAEAITGLCKTETVRGQGP